MPFDPTKPANGDTVDAVMIRNQFNALHDELVAAMAALDWSNGAPKLPEFSTIASPVAGNIAFDYGADHLMVYDGADWQTLG